MPLLVLLYELRNIAQEMVNFEKEGEGGLEFERVRTTISFFKILPIIFWLYKPTFALMGKPILLEYVLFKKSKNSTFIGVRHQKALSRD